MGHKRSWLCSERVTSPTKKYVSTNVFLWATLFQVFLTHEFFRVKIYHVSLHSTSLLPFISTPTSNPTSHNSSHFKESLQIVDLSDGHCHQDHSLEERPPYDTTVGWLVNATMNTVSYTHVFLFMFNRCEWLSQLTDHVLKIGLTWEEKENNFLRCLIEEEL